MSDKIREIHGVADCTKVSVGMSDHHEVTVTDHGDLVWLSIGGMTYPAGLTPEQADMIARQLTASAKRVRISDE